MLKLTIRRACRNSAGGQHKRGKFVSSVNQFSLAPDATNWRVSSAWRSCNLSSLPLAERQHKCGVGSTRRTGGRIDRRQSSAVTGRSEACMHRHADRGGEERKDIGSRVQIAMARVFCAPRASCMHLVWGSSAGPGALCSTELGGWNRIFWHRLATRRAALRGGAAACPPAPSIATSAEMIGHVSGTILICPFSSD
jgi:hypothetical protein